MEVPGPELQAEFFLWCAALLDLGASLPVHGRQCEGHPRAAATVLGTPTYLQVMEGVARVRAARHFPLAQTMPQSGAGGGTREGRNIRRASIRLAEAVALWCAEGEKDGSLLRRGKRLEEGVELLNRFLTDRTPQEIAFVKVSSAIARSEKLAPSGRRPALAAAGFVLALAVAVACLWRFGSPAASTRHGTIAARNSPSISRKPATAAKVPARSISFLADDAAGQAEQAGTLLCTGEVLAASGKLSGAMEMYRGCLAIRQRLAARDPRNAAWQRDLADAWTQVAATLKRQDDAPGALEAYREAEAIEQICVRARPDDTGLQRDLFFNALDIGDLLLAQNQSAEALEAFRRGSAVQRALCEREPQNALWRRDLAISFQRIADALDSQGDHTGALQGYQDSAAILQTLSTQDPRNPDLAEDLAAAQLKIGDLLLDHGKREEAVVQFAHALAAQQKLVALDGTRAEWQHALADIYERLGHVQDDKNDAAAGSIYAFGRALNILRLLSAQDATNADLRNDVCVALTEVGDAHVWAGDFPGAVASYREAVGMQQDLARTVPERTAVQPEIAETQDKIGLTLEAQKKFAEAMPAYRDAVAIYERLLAKYPKDGSLRSAAALVSYHLGRAAARCNPPDVATAIPALEKARDILLRMRSEQSPAFNEALADTLEDTTRLLTRARD